MDPSRPHADASELSTALLAMTRSQLEWVQGVIAQFGLPHSFRRNPASDLVTEDVLERFGDALRIHHAFSRQALSKDRFEFALERALCLSGFTAALAESRTNRGHDLTCDGTPISLKTEAAAAIRDETIHVSKWMELGKGEWRLDLLLGVFLEHMKNYDRIFTLRRIRPGPQFYQYELVEIPKSLMLEAVRARLVVQQASKQIPKPGYGHVEDTGGRLMFSLYFDGGTERKLQIKSLRKDLCVLHASWEFESTSL